MNGKYPMHNPIYTIQYNKEDTILQDTQLKKIKGVPYVSSIIWPLPQHIQQNSGVLFPNIWDQIFILAQICLQIQKCVCGRGQGRP